MLAVAVTPDMKLAKRNFQQRNIWPKRLALSSSSPQRAVEQSPASPVAVSTISINNNGPSRGGHVIINPFVDLLRYRKALHQATTASSSSPYALRETYCAPLLQTPRVSQAPSTPPRMVRQKYRLKDVFFKPPPACSPGYFTPRRTPRQSPISRANGK
ncbi:hypothetical protein BASA81_001243 [Batrachochytrium salamandrivorans]|nr:hypothetical protein BASA81_001243 [Batrachochytrium salamandrivorans]